MSNPAPSKADRIRLAATRLHRDARNSLISGALELNLMPFESDPDLRNDRFVPVDSVNLVVLDTVVTAPYTIVYQSLWHTIMAYTLSITPLTMHHKLIMTEGPEDPELQRRMARYRRNGAWLTEHGASLFEQWAGQYIAVAEGEVFVAADACEARRLARVKHPDDEPFVQYIPRESYERIYAC